MKYILKRKFFVLLGKEFTITDENNVLVAYAVQKAFKLKEELVIYADKEKTQPLVAMKARNILDFGATYDITDAVTGENLGAIRRMGLRSMFRDEWHILSTADQDIGIIQEESGYLAFIRRFVTNLVPQKYDLRIGEIDGGGFQQKFNLLQYEMEIDVNEALLDKRMAFSAGVLLGAVEGRQE